MNDYRISEVASLLKVTPATIRNYVNTFADFLSIESTQKTGKRFNHRDVTVLTEVIRLLRAGHTYDQVPDLLPAQVEVVDDQRFQEPPATPQEPISAIQTLELMEYIDHMLEQQRETYNQTIAAKDQLIERLESELERARRPWWRRW